MDIISFFKKIFADNKAVDDEANQDKLYQSENSFPDEEKAKKAFEKSKAKLFNVNRWSKLPEPTSKFELHKSNGIAVKSKKPRVGDYIRIELPGPTPENWVKVVQVKENKSMASFTVSPSEDPRDKDGEIEHFFIKEATSEFKVELLGNTIKGYEIGKKEGINNEGYEAGKRSLINTLIAEGGWAGFQKYQWSKVTDYFVHKQEIERKERKERGERTNKIKKNKEDDEQ